MLGCSRGPIAQQAVATAASASSGRASGMGTAMQQSQVPLQPQPLQQQLPAGPMSPSIIPLIVDSGAVVAPELDYTVGDGFRGRRVFELYFDFIRGI